MRFLMKFIACRLIGQAPEEFDFEDKVRVEVDQSVDIMLISLIYVVLVIFFLFFRVSNITVDPTWFARSGALLVICAVLINIYSSFRRLKINEVSLVASDVPVALIQKYSNEYKKQYGYLTEQDSADILLDKFIKKSKEKRLINQNKLILTEVLLAILGTFIWAFGDLMVKHMIGNFSLILFCDALVVLGLLKIFFYDVDSDVSIVFKKILLKFKLKE